MIDTRSIRILGLLFATLVATFVMADGVIDPAAKASGAVATSQKGLVGRASYYHHTLRGLRTANGERYDPKKLTAAHRRLPLDTWVKVTRLRGGQSVVVKINDRLPPRSRAIIDLSTAAARKLGMIRIGVAKVRLEIVDGPEDESH